MLIISREYDTMKKMNTRILFLLTVSIIAIAAQAAIAAEKIQFQSIHTNVATVSESIEIGDEPGHLIAMFQAKGVGVRQVGPEEAPYKIEIWGTGDYRGDGTGEEQGYGKFIFADGSSYYERWIGKVVDGQGKGTAVYFNGTGRFAGMKGGSKFVCTSLGDRFVCDVEGTIEIP